LPKHTQSSTLSDAIHKVARIDDLDLRIIALLVSGRDNKEIADKLRIPLSTIQRRTRRLFADETVRMYVEPNYRQLGYSKGVVHVYINNVEAMKVAQELGDVQGVISVSIHIGNSDIVGEIIYGNSIEVLNVLAACKRIEGVTKVVWSEEVYSLPSVLSEKKVLSYFKQTNS
jgi:DNA-binding Lrp family transcriptional regulator